MSIGFHVHAGARALRQMPANLDGLFKAITTALIYCQRASIQIVGCEAYKLSARTLCRDSAR
jgi:hypothetical protein